MSTFVLVHGAWHGGWCWDNLVPLLERAGHRVLAPDLPGLGDDRTPLEGLTLADWTASIVALIEAQPEPVVLVGHSRGGVVISEVAEARPDKVEKLVYLTAFLLQDGQSLFDVASTDTEAVIGPYFVPSEDGVSMGVRDEGIVPSFYAGCSAEDVARAKSLLRPEPMVGLVTPVHVTAENWGRVPRAYVTCLRDAAISPGVQERMYTALPCATVVKLDTDHSPFFSAPEELAEALLAV